MTTPIPSGRRTPVVRRAWRRVVTWTPIERATDPLLLTRWRASGIRMLQTVLGVGILSAAPAVVVLVATQLLPLPVSLVLAIATGAAAFGAIAWFAPPGRIERRPLHTIDLGTFIAVHTRPWSLDAAPVIAWFAESSDVPGTWWIGTKDGAAYSAADNASLPVVRLIDPYRRWRDVAPREDVLPPAAAWLRPLVDTTIALDDYEGPTHGRSADREAVVARLVTEGLPDPGQAQEVIDLGMQLGLLERRRVNRRRLRVSNAGTVWHRALTATPAPPGTDDGQPETGGQPDAESAEGSTPPPRSDAVGGRDRDELRDVIREALAEQRLRPSIPPEQFGEWMASLLHAFAHAVESGIARQALWAPNGEPQDERGVQSVAFGFFHAYCENADVDISREANAGNGAVDFKFSQGWSARALLEVKLLRSTRLFQGAERQVPAYIQAEDVDRAYYVCVGFTDEDLAPPRLERVRALCRSAAESTGAHVEPVFVDARRPPPASRR